MHYQFPNISIIPIKISLTISFDKKNYGRKFSSLILSNFKAVHFSEIISYTRRRNKEAMKIIFRIYILELSIFSINHYQ